MTGSLVIAAYRPKPGQEEALEALLRDHVPALRRLGLATDRAPIVGVAGDGTWIEVFEWVSEQAVAGAHEDPEVLALWERFEAACDWVAPASIAGFDQPFPALRPVAL